MRNGILLLLIIPTIVFSQPNEPVRMMNHSAKKHDSLVYSRIEGQIEEMETNFISTPHLKNAGDVSVLLDSTRAYQFTTLQDSLLIDRTVLSYHPFGSIKSKSNYIWHDYLKKMLNNKFDYLYDRGGKLTSVTFNEWEVFHYDAYTSPDGVFHPEDNYSINYLTRYEYKYDRSGRQSNFIHMVYEEYNQLWHVWVNTQYYYDITGNKKSMESVRQENIRFALKEEYSYDMNNNLETITQYNKAADNAWFYSGKTKYDYTYDSENRITSLLSSYWSFNASQWKTVSKVDYSYHANGGLESRIYSIIDTLRNEMVPANRTEFRYNQMDKINLREDYAWNKTASQWELRKKQYYYYNYSDPTVSVNELNLNSDMPFSIFPNPAKDRIWIENTDNTNLSIHIYNDIGQCVKTEVIEKGMNTIDLFPLPKGIYILTIPLNKEIKSCKLIIE